ncbi:MAG: thioredoxin domain-containing protein [Candidatus Binataceae bacterium]
MSALSALAAPSTPGAAAASRSSDPRDARLIDFLQKRLKLSDTQDITLGPLSPIAIAGLWSRSVSVTGPQGAKLNLTLFMDSTSNKVIVGQMFDLSQDPWGRVDLKGLHLEDRPTMGPADAPVTIVEFADLECPYCARALTVVESMVNGKYKGKARLIFKNYPLSGHLWAGQAAIAAECARVQNPAAFWDFVHDMYRDQGSIKPDNLRKHIDDYAASLKLDSAALSACMMAKSTDARIAQDVQDGVIAHVQSTPTFFVNGIPVVGLVDEQQLDFVIASELKPPQAAAR